MHTKQTVRYIGEKYPSGNTYFFKQELITSHSWDYPESLYWGRKSPVTEKTFRERMKQGYKCKIEQINKQPGALIYFPSHYTR